MASTALSQRLPWTERWTKPALDELLDPLKVHHRRVFAKLMDRAAGFAPVKNEIIWYGPGWKWTLHYYLPPATGKGEPETFCYLVPDPNAPVLCIPLRKAVIDQLPLQRFRKYVRDGIVLAKCAVEIYWATWTPATEDEVNLLTDVLKRKHDFLLHGPKAKREPAGNGKHA